MTREAIKVPLPDGNFKIVFRDSNSKPEKHEQRNEPMKESKSIDDKKKSRDPEKMRYYNPIHPGHVDIFGHDLLNKPIIISLVNGETIRCIMTGYAMYEILVEFDGRKVILLKQGILKIEVL